MDDGIEQQAEKAVELIFADIRDRRFLKWMFVECPENCGHVARFSNGDFLDPIDSETQQEIKSAWKLAVIEAFKSTVLFEGKVS